VEEPTKQDPSVTLNADELLVYEPSAFCDTLMLSWWSRMIVAGDLEKFMSREALAASNFFARIQKPSMLLFKANNEFGVWFAALLSPLFDGAYFDMWIDQSKRSGKGWVVAMEEALSVGFEQYPILIGATTQANLIDGHLRLGYNLVGMVPKLWNEKDLHLLYITRETFASRRSYLVRRAG
jgi:hypothetical protein